MMTAIDLAVGEVQDVAEDSANRRAHRVQDPKRLLLVLRRGHDQDLRPFASPLANWRPRLLSGPTATRASTCARRSTANAVNRQEKASRAPRIEQPFENERFRL